MPVQGPPPRGALTGSDPVDLSELSHAVPVRAPAVRLASPRSAALDGIRGIAALSVVVFHAQITGSAGGALGVDLFFVLSGFLITRLLIEEWSATGRLRIGRFWARRALRLWPPLAAMLVAGLLFVKDLSPDHTLHGYLHEAFSAATWSTNVVAALDPARSLPLGHTWTLAMEEQFYLVWPLVLLALLRTRLRDHLPAVLLGAAALSWVMLQVLWHDTAFLPAVYVRPDTRATPILTGCALALLVHRGAPRLRALAHPVVGVSGIALLVFAFAGLGRVAHSERGILVPGIGVVALGGFALIGHVELAPHGPLARALGWRPLAALGLISYSLYLVQNPLIRVLHKHGRFAHLRLTDELVTVAICVAAGTVLWALVERPLRPALRRLGGTAIPAPRAAEPSTARRTHRAKGARPRLRWVALPVLAATPLTFVLAGVATAIRWNHPLPTTARTTPGTAPGVPSTPGSVGGPVATVAGGSAPPPGETTLGPAGSATGPGGGSPTRPPSGTTTGTASTPASLTVSAPASVPISVPVSAPVSVPVSVPVSTPVTTTVSVPPVPTVTPTVPPPPTVRAPRP